MSDEDDFFDMPEDPELAFVKFERQFRARLEKNIQEAHESQAEVELYYLQYINNTLALSKALDLQAFDAWSVPDESANLHQFHRKFLGDVEGYIIQIKVRHARRDRRYSVRLDAAAKEKIRHYIDQIKAVVDRLEVDPDKRSALQAKISALMEEVDRDRTRYQEIGHFVVGVAEVLGRSSIKIRPLVDQIVRVIAAAKGVENELPRLGDSTPRKMIEPPRDSGEGQS